MQSNTNIELISTLTCRECGHVTEEEMPVDACTILWNCPNCQALLKPGPGECCVFCSFGTVKCPPVQRGEDCC